MHSMNQAFPNPEWIICGMQMPKGVRIVASKTLTRAELEANYQHHSIFDGPFPVGTVMTSYDLALTTHMRDLVIIDGSDYATCLKHLFEKWSPDKTEKPAIGPKQLGIEGSPTGRSNYPGKPAIGY
jgi:hypothetical protein